MLPSEPRPPPRPGRPGKMLSYTPRRARRPCGAGWGDRGVRPGLIPLDRSWGDFTLLADTPGWEGTRTGELAGGPGAGGCKTCRSTHARRHGKAGMQRRGEPPAAQPVRSAKLITTKPPNRICFPTNCFGRIKTPLKLYFSGGSRNWVVSENARLLEMAKGSWQATRCLFERTASPPPPFLAMAGVSESGRH